ncbi:MAG: hypothetical protein IH914_10440, partial [candidate division Zixibacteria bacterium]|nr:hypothetical protein [candidate division Zixibacteria bacterium]
MKAPIPDGVAAADNAIESYGAQRDELQARKSKVDKSVTDTQTQLDEMITNLTNGVVTEPITEIVLAASQELGIISLPGVLTDLEIQRDENQQRVTEINDDDRFQSRMSLIEPPAGKYVMAIADTEEQ